jgi:hypothetical protein
VADVKKIHFYVVGYADGGVGIIETREEEVVLLSATQDRYRILNALKAEARADGFTVYEDSQFNTKEHRA